MKVATALVGLAAIATASRDKHSTSYSFKPDRASSIWEDKIPIIYDFSESQLTNLSGSWWTSSYVTGTNKEQYLAISHVLDVGIYSYFRSSILNLNTHEYAQSLVTGKSVASNSPRLDIRQGKNGIQSLSPDNISKMRAYSISETVTFDIRYDATTGALPNAGGGGFQFGPAQSDEWGLPSCRTHGTLTGLDGKNITIDPQNSFTWYDRQWGPSAGSPPTGNWTWFQLHLPHSSEKFSIWFIDNPDTDQYAKFATIRGPNERLEVVPVEWTPRYQRSYRSTAEEKVLYPLDWTVRIGGVAEFDITSVAEDQEIVGSNALETAYEGFVTFEGKFDHHDVTGFGLVEIVYGSWDWL